LKVFPIVESQLFDVTRCGAMQFGPFRESDVNAGIPPPPRSIGIMMLERNCEIISWNQSLAGKILKTK
jgi:hypothetical protein